MAELAEEKARRVGKRNWVSLVPYGLNEQHPNNYKDILQCAWENRDNLPYAFRILNDGCCDGCCADADCISAFRISSIAITLPPLARSSATIHTRIVITVHYRLNHRQ